MRSVYKRTRSRWGKKKNNLLADRVDERREEIDLSDTYPAYVVSANRGGLYALYTRLMRVMYVNIRFDTPRTRCYLLEFVLNTVENSTHARADTRE